jgi:hypothetical protein
MGALCPIVRAASRRYNEPVNSFTEGVAMKSRWFVLILGVVLLSSLIGCNIGKPACDAASLVAVGLGNPPMWGTVDTLTPTLNWTYPESDCVPEGYTVHLETGPFFADDLGGSSAAPSWLVPSPLEPGTEYAWGIQPMAGSTAGPYAGSHYFFTGPSCVSGELRKPNLLVPANNAVVDDLGSLSLIWDYPDPCLPGGYAVNLSTSLVFDGSPLNGGTGNPSTRWGPGDPLDDCTRYYWRVAPMLGEELGQYSEVWTFRVDLTGTCAPETHGMIRGTVWNDQCALPDGPLPDPLPLGCVALAGGNAFSNGTYDPGEPGIGNLVVWLGEGVCPSTGYRAVGTAADGTFSFFELPAGDYCVSVDSADPMNVPYLIPGRWSSPAVEASLASRTYAVGAGEDVNNVNLGWWYQFGSGWGDTDATVYGLLWHDMCSVVPGSSPVPDPLPAGCALDPWGVVHADAVHQAYEPGIPGVTVTIGPGPCPSAGLAEVVTDENGYYHFDGLPAGDYCIRIDPTHDPDNEAILMPGSWTVIPSGHEGMTFRAITLGINQTLPGQDFGWDYDNLPLSLKLPIFTLTLNANCHQGPGDEYGISTYGLAGQGYHVSGRSEESDWFLIDFNDVLSCWVGSLTGDLSGELGKIPVVEAPAVPEEHAVNCAQYTNPNTCGANSACTWKRYVGTVGGYCANK